MHEQYNSKLKAQIPKQFYHGGDQPEVRTVEGLIKQLEQLPKSMTIDEPVKVVVANINYNNVHVSIREVW